MILVTGATGFLGKNFLSAMPAGKEKIRLLVRPASNTSRPDKPRFKFVSGDLSDLNSLASATKGVGAVVNLAAYSGSNKELLQKTNVEGMENLVQACKQNKVARIIHISSLATTRVPLDDYGQSKLEADKIIMNSGLKWIILRPTLIYGKGSSGLENLVKYVRAFPFIIPVIGNGKYKVMPVHVKDVCTAIISALEKENLHGKIYDLTGPDRMTFNQMLDILSARAGIRKIKVHVPVGLCAGIVRMCSIIPQFPVKESFIKSINRDTVADIAPAIADLNYAPVAFDAGLMDVA